MKRALIWLLAAPFALYGQARDGGAAARQLPEALWRAPRLSTPRDWTCTFAGCDQAPAPPFHLLKADTGGTTPKLLIRDSRGRSFDVKFGSKVIPECFSSRFVAALGYVVEPSYYVPSAKIEGPEPRLTHRVRVFVKPDGAIARARFQLRDPKQLEFLDGRAWPLADNPFRGTRELAGLRIVLMLLSNWDIKDLRNGQEESNTGVFRSPENGHPELLYSFFDWGSTLGEWGGFMRRTRSDCSGFSLQTPHFITGVRGDVVEFGYAGKRTEDVKGGITVADLRWLAPYLEQISAADLRAGLKASGATDRQTACWAGALEGRMQQIKDVARSGR